MKQTKTWELTEQEKINLSEQQLEKYQMAVSYMEQPDACGPFGGWSRGVELLVELGWEEQRTTKGHRVFLSLIKPTFCL